MEAIYCILKQDNCNRSGFDYVGLLRNQNKFQLYDKVYFKASLDGSLAYGKVIGVEVTREENPEYIYKLELSQYLPMEEVDNDGNVFAAKSYTLICDSIFKSLEDAKASALSQLERYYKSKNDEIEKYFSKLTE